MFNLFKKNKNLKKAYKIIFCDKNDPSTKFGEYCDCDTYEAADHIIRMAWNKRKEDRVNNGYQVKDGWIIIEKEA